MKLKAKNKNWYVFPMVGIQIMDQVDIEDFMFGDATLVNKDQLIKYLNDSNLYDRVLNIEGNLLSHTVLLIETERYLQGDDYKKDTEIALDRANQIAGFIYFVFLFLSDMNGRPKSPCLNQQAYSKGGTTIMRYSGTGGSSIAQGKTYEYPIATPYPPFCYTKEQLLDIFNKELFFNIFEIIKNRTCKFLENSIRNFYLATNVPSPISQQLGAVTSIEILVRESERDRFALIEKRLKFILNDEIFETFVEDDNGVLKKRHSILHSGADCTANDAFRAMRLYTYVVIVYVHLLKFFDRKIRLLKYIDVFIKAFYDTDLKNDMLDINSKWDKYKFDFSKFDWIITHNIHFYMLCNTRESIIEKIDFAKAIARYDVMRKVGLEQSYKLVNDFLYYNKMPFKNYSEFHSFYLKNKEEIMKDMELHVKNYEL